MKEEHSDITFWAFVLCIAIFLYWAGASNQKAKDARAERFNIEQVCK